MLSGLKLSVVIITFNEEANLRRTLESVRRLADEIIIIDSGSTDRTVEVARELGAQVFVEEWKGYAAQKNSAIAKASGDWILSLDADEVVSDRLAAELQRLCPTLELWRENGMPTGDDIESRQVRDDGLCWGLDSAREKSQDVTGFTLPRKNFFLGRWIRHGGFWPDRKLRLFRRGQGTFEERLVHETMRVDGWSSCSLREPLLHHAYPTLTGYLDHMNRYSSLGAEIAVAEGHRRFSFINIVLRPLATFMHKYFLKLGFLDGREGLLLCLYHSVYVSWKYAKAWELARPSDRPDTRPPDQPIH
jgi:glycosyltransferase involved in cell wall biosynthesis